MLRCIQSCHSGKCNDGFGWSIFLRHFKKTFLFVILHDLRKQPLRFTKPGNLLGVALPLCFLFCQHCNTIHKNTKINHKNKQLDYAKYKKAIRFFQALCYEMGDFGTNSDSSSLLSSTSCDIIILEFKHKERTLHENCDCG